MNGKYHYYVCIPVRNESKNILDNLKSLMNQKKIAKDRYSIFYLVSNHRKEAVLRNAVYLDNKKSLKIISDYYASIQRDKPQLVLIDNTEIKTAPSVDNIGLARRKLVSVVSKKTKNKSKCEAIIVTCDADTIVSSDYLYNLDRLFLSNEHIVGVGGTIRYQAFQDEISIREFLYFKIFDIGAALINNEPQISAQSFAFKLAFYYQVGGFRKLKGGEDIDLARRLLKVGEILISDKVVVYPKLRYSDRCNGNGLILLHIHQSLGARKVVKFRLNGKLITVKELMELLFKSRSISYKSVMHIFQEELRKNKFSLTEISFEEFHLFFYYILLKYLEKVRK